MRNVIYAIGALALASLASAQPSAAQERGAYPWCGEEGSAETCTFNSLDQCLATVRGEGQVCSPNPDYPPARAQSTDGHRSTEGQRPSDGYQERRDSQR